MSRSYPRYRIKEKDGEFVAQIKTYRFGFWTNAYDYIPSFVGRVVRDTFGEALADIDRLKKEHGKRGIAYHYID